MRAVQSRRGFLRQVAAGSVLAAGAVPAGTPAADKGRAPPEVPDHTLTVIAGKPRERGRQYGRLFKGRIAAFLDREVYRAFEKQPAGRGAMRRYAGLCAKAVATFSPLLSEEVEGLAEGSGLQPEEVVLLSLHEELYHKGVLPSVDHCTAIAAGPPDTCDGRTYVGQNWDWMESVYGLSSVLLWKRPEGPSLLAYSYPGLWAGAGLNSAGIALCWTSTQGNGIPSPRVGIPSYLLIAHLLYQESLRDVIAEAKRAPHAGWFTFVLADGKGNLLNIEGSPKELAVEESRGSLARVYYGSRQMTRTPQGKEVPRHPQCRRMCDLLAAGKGRLDRPTLQGFFGDHESTICKHPGTLDSMLFDCTKCEAHVSRGPGCSGRWKTFRFDSTPPAK
jgi:hypothetical protein